MRHNCFTNKLNFYKLTVQANSLVAIEICLIKVTGMLILQEQHGNDGSFFIEKANRKVAQINYTISTDNALTIEHTIVDEELRNNNIGFDLVAKVVEYARDKQYKVIPECSFAKAVFEKEPGFSDVLTRY